MSNPTAQAIRKYVVDLPLTMDGRSASAKDEYLSRCEVVTYADHLQALREARGIALALIQQQMDLHLTVPLVYNVLKTLKADVENQP